jgi:hypothetical protein
MKNLCRCGHDVEAHTMRTTEYDGTVSTFIGPCSQDRVFFKGMCCCSWFIEADNLTHIELLAKQRKLI